MIARSAFACTCIPDGDSPTGPALWRTIASIFIAMNSMTLSLAVNTSEASFEERRWLHGILLAAAVAVILLQGPVLFRKSFDRLREGRITIELLFVFTAFGAMTASIVSVSRGAGPVYFETIAVVLAVYAAGQQLGAYAEDRFVRLCVERDGDLLRCERVDAAGNGTDIDFEQVIAGDVLRIHPGRLVPVDGVVLAGTALTGAAEITGEPGARARQPGDSILAGTVVLDSTICVRASVPGGGGTLDGLARLLARGTSRPSRLQQSTEQALRWFFPSVVASAAATFAVWTALSGPEQALFYAMSVLLVACPCGLGLSVPLATWTSCYKLRQLGVTVRNPSAVEELANIDVVLIDKTGTLTTLERQSVVERHVEETIDREIIVACIDALERASDHPFAQALRSWASPHQEGWQARRVAVLPGIGLTGDVRTPSGGLHRISIGRAAVLAPSHPATSDDALAVVVDEQLAAVLLLTETNVAGVQDSVRQLERMGIEVELITGDEPGRAANAGVARFRALQLPSDKQDIVKTYQRQGRRVLFIGDGLNDAAALLVSDAAMAVSTGSAAAIALADLLWSQRGGLPVVPHAIAICREAMRRARLNIRVAIGYNLIGITIAALGLLHPAGAALLMVCSSLFVLSSSFLLMPSDAPTPVTSVPQETEVRA